MSDSPRRLPLYVTRQRNGLYMLSARTPVPAPVGASGVTDIYVPPGDPVGLRNVCPWFVGVILGVKDLPFGEPTRVWLAGGVPSQSAPPPPPEETSPRPERPPVAEQLPWWLLPLGLVVCAGTTVAVIWLTR